jgi:hypothetical protein
MCNVPVRGKPLLVHYLLLFALRAQRGLATHSRCSCSSVEFRIGARLLGWLDPGGLAEGAPESSTCRVCYEMGCDRIFIKQKSRCYE